MNKVILKARGQQFEYSCASDITPLRAARGSVYPHSNRVPARRMWHV